MSDEPEVIREQMLQTRSALTEKLEALEQHVVGTVVEANTAVAETVENVKEAVQDTVQVVKGSVEDTVESLREAFNISRQVDQHPWLFCGAAVALGYLSGRWLQGAASDANRLEHWRGGMTPPDRPDLLSRTDGFGNGRSLGAAPVEQHRARKPGWLDSLRAEFGDEIDKLKSMAIGAGLSLVRNAIVESAPEALRPRIHEVMENITTKLGGEPIHGPGFDPECARTEPSSQDFAFRN